MESPEPDLPAVYRGAGQYGTGCFIPLEMTLQNFDWYICSQEDIRIGITSLITYIYNTHFHISTYTYMYILSFGYA